MYDLRTHRFFGLFVCLQNSADNNPKFQFIHCAHVYICVLFYSLNVLLYVFNPQYKTEMLYPLSVTLHKAKIWHVFQILPRLSWSKRERKKNVDLTDKFVFSTTLFTIPAS